MANHARGSQVVLILPAMAKVTADHLTLRATA
jgi:hypothetical protein